MAAQFPPAADRGRGDPWRIGDSSWTLDPMRTLIVLALLTAAASVDAKVYTWTDANGVVHYTDRPIAPGDAEVVKGVETAREEPVPEKPEEPVRISETALQGTWCEYEVASDKASGDAVPERIEWAFSGSTLTQRDLKSGRVIESQFRVEGPQIVSDKAAMGNRTVRKFDDDGMELTGESAYHRLRRGRC
jgi:hypothetical protein